MKLNTLPWPLRVFLLPLLIVLLFIGYASEEDWEEFF